MKKFLVNLPLILGIITIAGSFFYGVNLISDANDKYSSLREKNPDNITIKYMTEDRGCYVTDLEPNEDYISEFLNYQENSPCTIIGFYTKGFGTWFLYIFGFLFFLNFFYKRLGSNRTNLDIQKKYRYSYYVTFTTIIATHIFLLSAYMLVLMSMGGDANDYILKGAILTEIILLPLTFVIFLLNNWGQHLFHKKKFIALSVILFIPEFFITLVFF